MQISVAPYNINSISIYLDGGFEVERASALYVLVLPVLLTVDELSVDINDTEITIKIIIQGINIKALTPTLS